MAPHLAGSTVWILGLIHSLASSLEYDICSQESASLSFSLARPGDFIDVHVNWSSLLTKTGSYSCTALVETCDYCRVRVTALEPWFDYPVCRQASGAKDNCVRDCVHLILSDANYKSAKWKKVSNPLAANGFVSLSKHLQIVACGIPSNQIEGTTRLRLTSLEKMQVVNGNMLQPLLLRTIMSPDFPNPYVASNESFTYRLLASSPKEYITVTFDDWMLSPLSSVQFEGANVNRITGNNIRPYVISRGQSMIMTFNTGTHQRMSSGGAGFLGFKAVARFYSNQQSIPNIETGCDSFVNTSEGGILHLNAAANRHNRDCVWVIKKLASFDGVYLKVIRYRTRYELLDSCNYSLEVRAGLTSMAKQRLKIKPNDLILNDAVQLSEWGFYIRIKGCYLDDSLLLSYAMFSNDCDDYREHYKCDNGQCIPEHLRCDTFDHCGDKSDEIPSMCGRSSSKVRPIFGDPSTSNISNSNNYDYSISIHIIIPLVVATVLGIGIMCLLVILVRRCRHLSNITFRRRLPNDCVAQTRGRGHFWSNRGVQMGVTMSSGAHPPSYEDVLRSTPIGHLNMAFSWSTCENNITQPPSYEEAVTNTSGTPQPCGDIVPQTADSSSEYQEETTPPFSSQPAPAFTRSASPQVGVQSSCSLFEDSAGSSQLLDVLSPTESSAKDQHHKILNEHCSDYPITSSKKELDSETSPQRSIAKYGTHMVSEYSLSTVVKSESNSNVRHDRRLKDYKHLAASPVINQQNKMARSLIKDSNVIIEACAQSLATLGVNSCSQNIDCEDTTIGHYQDLHMGSTSKESKGHSRHKRQHFDVGVGDDDHVSLKDEIQLADCAGCSSKGRTGLAGCSSKDRTGLAGCSSKDITGLAGCSSKDITGLAGCSSKDRTGLASCSSKDRTGLAGCSSKDRTGLAGCSSKDRTGLAGCSSKDITGLAGCSSKDRTGLAGCSFKGNTRLSCSCHEVANSSRCRSCSDLSLDRGREELTEGEMHDDKRFGYAGVGHVSLLRQSFNPFYDSLVDEPSESLWESYS